MRKSKKLKQLTSEEIRKEFHKQSKIVHRDVKKFLKDLDKFEKESKKVNIVFK